MFTFVIQIQNYKSFRYNFIPAKNPFGDCGGNITDSENGFIKSPNYPEKYTTNDQSKLEISKN